MLGDPVAHPSCASTEENDWGIRMAIWIGNLGTLGGRGRTGHMYVSSELIMHTTYSYLRNTADTFHGPPGFYCARMRN